MSKQWRTLTASAITGFAAAFLILPFDFLKTRLQGQESSLGAGQRYRGMADCALRVARDEGLRRFYRGFGMYFLRIAPHRYVKRLAGALSSLTLVAS